VLTYEVVWSATLEQQRICPGLSGYQGPSQLAIAKEPKAVAAERARLARRAALNRTYYERDRESIKARNRRWMQACRQWQREAKAEMRRRLRERA